MKSDDAYILYQYAARAFCDIKRRPKDDSRREQSVNETERERKTDRYAPTFLNVIIRVERELSFSLSRS